MPEVNVAPISFKSLDDSLARGAAKGGIDDTGIDASMDTVQNASTHFQRSIDKQELIVFPWAARIFLFLLLTVFVSIGATYFWAINNEANPTWLAPLMTVLWLAAGSGVILLFYWMWRQFNLFSKDLSVWASQLLQGDTDKSLLNKLNC